MIFMATPEKNTDAVYDASTLGTPKMLVLGLQHLFAMFGATVLVPAITGLNVSTTLLFAGLGTLLFHLITGRKVPAFLGSSFAFLGAYGLVTASGQDIPLTYSCFGVAVAGLVYLVLALFFKLFGAKKVMRFFPPIVTGPIIICIGLSLAGSAINNCRGNWWVALVAILVVVVCNIWGKGMVKIVPILLGVLGSYLFAMIVDPAARANVAKTVAEAEPLYALRRCDKLAGKVAPRYQYQGMPSCAAAALMRGGTDVCVYSCLGFGDCVQACPFGAMEVRDGLVRVDRGKCTGCGVCVSACPRGILELTPQRGRVAVYCNTRDKLRAVMDVCDVGCIKCGKCIKACPAKAVRLEDNRIVIDQLQCLSYGPVCEEVCVSGCPRHILRSTRKAIAPRPAADAEDTAATPPAPAGQEQSQPQPQA